MIIDDEDKIFTKSEIPARFPGGDSAWNAYLHKNLNTTIPASNGMLTGTYTVMAVFEVRKDGTLTEISTKSAIDTGMDYEVIRLIKHSPKWIPARQNGRQVNAFVLLPIIFKVE